MIIKTMLENIFIKIIGLAAVTLCLVACTSTSAPSTVNTKKSVNFAAENNIKLGLAYLEQGKIPQAKEKLLNALKQAPQNYLSYDAMGYFLEKTGEAKAAEQYYLKAMQLAPHNGAAYNNYGTYLYRQKRYQDAIHYFTLAVKEPNYLHTADAYENAGLAALKIPDKKLAKMYFEKAIASDPRKKTSH